MTRRLLAIPVFMVILVLFAACSMPQQQQVVFTPIVPSPASISLTGPEMKESSAYQYVDGSLLVAVPAGPFTMGADGVDNPQHTVTLSDFWIYSTEVTNQQYANCVQGGGCTDPDKNDNPTYADPGRVDDPVVGVTYDQSTAYCTFVHGRLPTEAEWEKTARGPNANIYPWGNDAPTCDLLNFNKCVGKTTNVSTYPQGQSYYLALDMEGNAFEWVADRYSPTYYKESPPQDPLGPDTGQYRSVRSSSFASTADQIPASTRSFDLPDNHRNDLGIRCVVEDPTYFAPFCQNVTISGSPLSPSSRKGDCEVLTGKSEPVCLPGKVPAEIVTIDKFPLPPGGSIDVPAGCMPLSGGKYQCPDLGPGAYIRVYNTCIESAKAGCAPGYHLDSSAKSCVPDFPKPGTGSCIPGYTYDPANQCCSASPSKAMPYGPCPPGWLFGKVSGVDLCAWGNRTDIPLIPGDCANKPPGEEPPPGVPPPPCNPNDPNCAPP